MFVVTRSEATKQSMPPMRGERIFQCARKDGCGSASMVASTNPNVTTLRS